MVYVLLLLIYSTIFSLNAQPQHLWHDAKKTKEISWRQSIEAANNAVVQVRAYNLHFDWRQPFRAPHQSFSSGTAFFINKQGYLATNSHVVSHAAALQITIPACGRELFDVEVVGICPDLDVALLRLTAAAYAQLVTRIGSIPFLPFGDSDTVIRTEELLVLGYPLGLEKMKCTQGIFAGREYEKTRAFFHITAALNPGNSGGPVLNKNGEVIAMAAAGYTESQLVGYAIPGNNVKAILDYLAVHKLLHLPRLYMKGNFGSDEMCTMLGNPLPGGPYISRLPKHSLLWKAGARTGDMLYEVIYDDIHYLVDRFGETRVPWSEDPVPLFELLNRFPLGANIGFALYRKGELIEGNVIFATDKLPSVRKKYALFESIDYEALGGLVIMELAINHFKYFPNHIPYLGQYADPDNNNVARLIITDVLANSVAYNARSCSPGDIIKKVNGVKVYTLEDFREQVSASSGQTYLTIKTKDGALAAISIEKLCAEEESLAARHKYPISSLVNSLKIGLLQKSNQ